MKPLPTWAARLLIALCAFLLLRAVFRLGFSEGWLTGFYDAQTGGRPIGAAEPTPATPGTARPVYCGERGVEV